jgi:hypothetical protein
MVKCPFCGFDNEDGAIFCEQCKSDLNTAPAPAEPAPVAAIIEEVQVVSPVEVGGVPMAQVVEAVAIAAVVPEAAPVEPEAGAPAEAPPGAGPASCPPGSQVKLVVRRGQKIGAEFPVYPDYNYIGRADEKPVDIDLEDQEPPDRVWCSRQHAVIHYDEAAGIITIEDLNSSNGTYVNRNRVYPGQKKQLFPNDTIQIGTVHMQVKV